MKGRFARISMVFAILCMVGCSRTVEDVSKWKSEGNTDKLKEALTDPKFEVRQAAAEALGSLKAENAVDTLAACLNDAEESVQLAAIDALAAIGTPNTVMPLTAAFKLSNIDARLKAAEALGKLKAEAAIEVLVDALDDPVEEIQLAACETLGKIGREAGSAPLAARLASESASVQVRLACIAALADTGGATALNALVDTLADGNESIREAATTALLKIGRPAIPSMIEGLRNANPIVRSASIKLLRGVSAIPTRGSGLVWYELARASLTEDAAVKAASQQTVAAAGASVVPALIEAASLPVPDIRELAARSLEWIGEPALEAAMAATQEVVLFERQQWLKGRAQWIGAPSPLLDLYAAVSVLNPAFPKAMDSRAILNDPEAAQQRAFIPVLVTLLADDASRPQAVARLESSGPTAALPLIAAISSGDTAVAEAAASILEDRRDPRALAALMRAIETRLDAGTPLSRSPLFNALIKLDEPEAEPVLEKVRPNTERAMRVFSKQYRAAKVIGAETADPLTDSEAPVSFRIAYMENSSPGTLEVTFKKDEKGKWFPSPALPYALPKPKK